MSRPEQKTLLQLRNQLAVRLGFGGQSAAAYNASLLNNLLQNAQEELWERLETPSIRDEIDAWAGPGGRTSMPYPAGIDPDRLRALTIDYSGNRDWYPMITGIEWDHDSTVELNSFPRRYEHMHDALHLWPQTDSRDTYNLTGVTLTNPVGVQFAAEPNVEVGAIIRIMDVTGTTQLNGNFYQILSVGTTCTLGEEVSGAPVDGTLFSPWVSGGIMEVGYKLRFDGYMTLGAFEADTDRCTLPSNLVFLQALADGKAHYDKKDAPIWMKRAMDQLVRYRGRIHGDANYIPAGKNRRMKTEMIKPGRV